MFKVNPLIGLGVGGGFSEPFTVFSDTLTANTGNNAGFSFRSSFSVSAGGDQIRITFEASNAAAFDADNCAIGIQDTAADTTATPVELLFGETSGFTLTAGQTITSDWLDFPFSVSDTLIVITDCGATNGNARRLAAGASNWYFRSATNSYQDAAVTGFTDSGADTVGFNLVEARNAF